MFFIIIFHVSSPLLTESRGYQYRCSQHLVFNKSEPMFVCLLGTQNVLDSKCIGLCCCKDNVTTFREEVEG